ncbi:hypothetical protein HDU79_011039 [Rhizoclosmatium sp. JEL0117]|nr:hypothetical protein HDU79_011039 [Rhizoclosmatium sp. JEL0117]
MQKYSGDATEIIATLNTLVPGSLNQLNANQVSSSLFQITEPIRPGGAPVTFLGAAFGSGSNAVVVLITSTQYKFTGLPSAQDIQVYNDVTCSITIKTVSFSNEGGVGFSYVLDASYKSEWFAMQLDSEGTKLIVSVYSEHAAVASIVFGVEAIGGKRGVDDVGFVVVNGVGVVNKPDSSASVTSLSTMGGTSTSGPGLTALSISSYSSMIALASLTVPTTSPPDSTIKSTTLTFSVTTTIAQAENSMVETPIVSVTKGGSNIKVGHAKSVTSSSILTVCILAMLH